jgi:hypothetical protein
MIFWLNFVVMEFACADSSVPPKHWSGGTSAPAAARTNKQKPRHKTTRMLSA